MFIPLIEKTKIANGQRLLERQLKDYLGGQRTITFGYKGGTLTKLVCCNDDMWFYSKKIVKDTTHRYWNVFGLKIKDDISQNIVVEINPPTKNYIRITAGLFVRDASLSGCFLTHRGRIGGGVSGVGRKAFVDWYRGDVVQVAAPDGYIDEVIMLGNIESPKIGDQIFRFVREVADFKKQVREGNVSRKPRRGKSTPTYNSEFWGNKKVKISKLIEYESWHGLIVDALEKHIVQKEGKDVNVFNDRYVDLGVQKNGELTGIYEVKTSADRQSVYTAIGQLMIHSGGVQGVRRTIVLPRGGLPKDFKNIFKRLGVEIVEYQIKNKKVLF